MGVAADSPQYSLCCQRGAIQLDPVPIPPSGLRELFLSETPESKWFLDNIRTFNNAFSFVSLGCKIDRSFHNGRGPNTFRIQGTLYHRLGNLDVHDNQSPKYAQVYFYDRGIETQTKRRLQFINYKNRDINDHDKRVVRIIQYSMRNNPYAKIFKTAGGRISKKRSLDLTIKLINHRHTRTQDRHRYNLPSKNEVAAILPGDGSDQYHDRDIVVQYRGKGSNVSDDQPKFKNISALHPAYWPLAYAIFFPFGTDGFHLGIPRGSGCGNGRDRTVTMMDYYSYRLQYRPDDGSQYILRGRGLFEQLCVDMFTTMDMARLKFLYHNQSKIRAELYQGMSYTLIAMTN